MKNQQNFQKSSDHDEVYKKHEKLRIYIRFLNHISTFLNIFRVMCDNAK